MRPPWPPQPESTVLLAGAIYLVARQRFPTILLQPQNKISEVRSNLSLAVVAKGGGLKYQWWREEEEGRLRHLIPGKTNASLRFPSAQTNDSGLYFVVVANRAGAATSGVVKLTVATTILTVKIYDNTRAYGDYSLVWRRFEGRAPGRRHHGQIRFAGIWDDSSLGRYDIFPVFSDPGGKLRNYAVVTNLGWVRRSRPPT